MQFTLNELMCGHWTTGVVIELTKKPAAIFYISIFLPVAVSVKPTTQ